MHGALSSPHIPHLLLLQVRDWQGIGVLPSTDTVRPHMQPDPNQTLAPPPRPRGMHACLLRGSSSRDL
jgi:hypothetical protein